tara:strand:+ start:322 stop:1239 length:918 start_codon:yes stop_codon:yes gene_type:complete
MFDKVIIWGHKLHTHTHSYIHYGFYKAFKHLNYDVYWLDDNDINNDMNNNIYNNLNFDNCLFITEGQVDKNIPINESSIYILHNCSKQKYRTIKKKFNLQVITKSDLERYKFNRIDIASYYGGDQLVLCWATDLLPEEINNNILKVKENKIISKNVLNFVGMPLYPWDEVQIWCNNNNIEYNSMGGFSNTNVSSEKNMELIQESILAPAIQEPWQVEHGYIPCRVFKNLSYGKMVLTNNRFVNDYLFEGKLLYNEDIHKLMDMGIEFNNNNQKKLLIELMENVRDNHTYINRIQSIIKFLEINSN